MKRSFSFLALSLVLSTACSPAPAPQVELAEPESLSVAIASWVGFAPIYLAQDLGFYEDAGLELNIVEINDLSAMKASIQSDQIDLSWGTGDILLSFADAGIDLEAFYAIDWSNGGDGLVVTDEIQDWADFEGKSIAAQEGFPPANLILYALKENGVDLSTVSFQEMETSAAALAFKAGQVDIAALYQPYLYEASQREGARIFMSSADYPYVITDFISAKPGTLQEKATAVDKFVTGTDQAIAYIHAEPELAAQQIAGHFGVTPEEVLEIFLDIEFPTLEENRALFSSEDLVNSFTTFQGAMLEAGVLTSEHEIAPMINKNFVQ